MIIGLHGVSRAGKDSIAARLVKRHGFEQRVLADPIRAILYRLNPVVRDMTGDYIHLARLVDDYGWSMTKSLAPEATQLMIRLGQSARDLIDPDVWIKTLSSDEDFDPSRRTVISDCRQQNEVDFIRSHGGELWLVTRPGTVDQGMDNLLEDVEFDAYLVNDGTLDWLDCQVDRIMQSHAA